MGKLFSKNVVRICIQIKNYYFLRKTDTESFQTLYVFQSTVKMPINCYIQMKKYIKLT